MSEEGTTEQERRQGEADVEDGEGVVVLCAVSEHAEGGKEAP